jgi:hypothetical protein
MVIQFKGQLIDLKNNQQPYLFEEDEIFSLLLLPLEFTINLV